MKNLMKSALILLYCIALASCATGSKPHKDGLVAMDSGDYEAGIQGLEDAAREDPSNLTYKLDLKTAREQAIQRLMAKGNSARAAGDLDTASSYYDRVLGIESRNGRALRGLDAIAKDRVHAMMVKRAQVEEL